MKHTRKQISPMQTLRRAVRNRREHGMALLFTLCILSMALITAMIFSSNATMDRKVAAAYVDTSAARILADGTVSRAVLALMSSNASYACSSYLKDPPKNGTKKQDEYASDWIWKIEKPGIFSFDNGPLRYSKQYFDRDDTRCPSWEYVYYHNPDGNDRIYGRYAYVAIGQNDQLNPNALGSYRGRKLSSEDIAIRDKRLGRLTCEPKFLFVDKNNLWGGGSGGDPIISAQGVVDACPAAGWTDMDVFFNDVASSGDKHLRMMVDQYFTLSGYEEYNKYNPKGDAISDFTTVPTGNEQYRFPLIRGDWDTIDYRTLKREIPYFRDASSDSVDQTIANLINYNASFSRAPVTDVANWATGSPTFTGNKCTPYINEVAGMVEVSGNLGIRMTEPYLDANNNRLWRIWYTDCTYSHTVTLKIETVNMYGGMAQGVSAPVPFGTVSYEYYNPERDTWIPQEFTFDANNTRLGSPVIEAGPYTKYIFIVNSDSVGSVTTTKRDGYSRPMGYESHFQNQIQVRDVRVRLDRVLLRDASGQNADLALMPSDYSSGNGTLLINGPEQVAGRDPVAGCFDIQVDDPRCNLNPYRNNTIWKPQSVTKGNWDVNMGDRNTAIAYDPNRPNDFDPGESGNPVDGISTAYIPHRAMESLWELGAIHRGSPWQTINLKCAGSKSNGSAMGNYGAGDGHLLDQVSLVPVEDERKTVMGMINLNCVADLGSGGSPFVFKSLFTDFPVYDGFANMRNNAPQRWLRGHAVNSDDSDADRLAQDLVESVTYAIHNNNKPRRTAIFPDSAASGSRMGRLIPTTGSDAQREELICRVINILKWGRQQTRRATVLVLAQTIQDVGGASGKLERNLPKDDTALLMDSGFKPYDTYDDAKWIEPPQYTGASIIRSEYKSRDVAFKQYDNFYDRITGEAKVIVRLEWDDSANESQGAWKVTRKEYAE